MDDRDGRTPDLHAALATLHALVGAPTDRQLENYASLVGHRLARATANTVRRGRGKPRWETVEAFVAACRRYAETRKPPIKVPDEYANVSRWYKLHEDSSSDGNKTKDLVSLSASLPRSLVSPARLLDPEYGAVQFIGRVAELADLISWCEDNSTARLRLLTGPGGIGKTRLALQLAKRLKDRGWRCELVGDRQETNILSDIRVASQDRVLLIVDYAETRIGLEELLRNVATYTGIIRVLMLARSAGQWWEQVAAGEGAIRDLVVEAGPEGIPLGEVLDDLLTDEEAVNTVIPVFAAAFGVSPPEHVVVAPQARRARVLELHAAALVAVLDWIAAPKVEPRVDLGGVLGELLRHEERFWMGSARAQGLLDGPTGMTPTSLRQVIAVGCLLGAADQAEAVALLSRVPGVVPSVKLATWLRELYPPGNDSPEWLGIMQPDRLAEQLVVSQLSRSETLTRTCLSGLENRQARRAVLLLARAATEDDIAERLLRQLLPLVAKVVEDIDAPLETLVSIANAIPYPSMILGTAHAVITRRILDAPATSAHPAEHARWLSVQGKTLIQLGRSAEALPVTRQATGLYREMASVNPGRYEPDLAESLDNFGTAYSELGLRAEALTAAEEALSLFRKLTSANPGRYLHSLAKALTNLGSRLSDLGRPDEALAVTEEATGLLRDLAKFAAGRYQSDLAITLINLGARFSDLGRRDEALTVTREAADIYRELASASPDRHQPDFAAALGHLGGRLSAVGRLAEAVTVTQEAASLIQDLALVSPDQYMPNMAGFLSSLGALFLDLGRLDDALAAEQEAVRLYGDLAVSNPDLYRPSLAVALSKLGSVFAVMGRTAESLATTQEAVSLYRGLAVANSDRYRAELAYVLKGLGAQLSESGRLDEALTIEQEATNLYRELAATFPDRYKPDLALSWMIVGTRFSELERTAEALSAERAAINLYRELAADNPEWYRPNLALSLMVLSAQLSQSGLLNEALSPGEEAVNLFRAQIVVNPGQYQSNLAASLTSLSFTLSDTGRSIEALDATREAAGLYSSLALGKAGVTGTPLLAQPLFPISDCLIREILS